METFGNGNQIENDSQDIDRIEVEKAEPSDDTKNDLANEEINEGIEQDIKENIEPQSNNNGEFTLGSHK